MLLLLPFLFYLFSFLCDSGFRAHLTRNPLSNRHDAVAACAPLQRPSENAGGVLTSQILFKGGLSGHGVLG